MYQFVKKIFDVCIGLFCFTSVSWGNAYEQTLSSLKNSIKDPDKILRLYDIDSSHKLAEGAESILYKIDDEKIIRLYKSSSKKSELSIEKQLFKKMEYAFERKYFYEKFSKSKLPYTLPYIYTVGSHDYVAYSIENFIDGQDMYKLLLEFPDSFPEMLLQYFIAVDSLKKIKLPKEPFGQILSKEENQKETWVLLLEEFVSKSISKKREHFEKNKIDIDLLFKYFSLKAEMWSKRGIEKNLVHGDIFPPNVMLDSKDFSVKALVDFSDITMVGDHHLDLAVSLFTLELLRDIPERVYTQYEKILREHYPETFDQFMELYTLLYAFLYADTNDTDNAWAIKKLKYYQEYIS